MIVSQVDKMLKILIFLLLLNIHFQLSESVLSMSYRPFIMEDISNAQLYTNILSVAGIALLSILIAKCTGN
jgi:hypothetical protein